jgi:glutathione synthase/RimK-type ligase-like ATP-grasp enzyme
MKLQHIGTTEFVSMPDDGITTVPAKVDTGADGSVIWASNIHLEDGKLLFNFFAAGSAFYRPEPVITTAFRVTRVRNSFGTEEFRYKIRLKLRLGEHTLTRWFSLADRSRNNYPVLLGKNFLKNRFVVDVAQKNLHGSEDAHDVLILTGFPTETGEFFNQVSEKNKLPTAYQCVDFDALIFYIDGANTKVVNAADEANDIANYRLTFFKNHHNREFSYAAAEYLHYRNKPFVDTEFLHYMSSSKLSEYMKLTCYGLDVPTTVCAKTHVLRERFDELKKLLGLPFVLKEMSSDKGKNNFLIREKKQFMEVMDSALPNFTYLAQRYVPNDGFYRIYVLGKEASLAIWRSTTPHADPLKAHLNKPRGSLNATNVPLDKLEGEAEDFAVQAASCLNRQICGVDILQDKLTKKWYILEANNDPQIRTGSFLDAKVDAIAAFIDKELNS